jgi:PKHD-type hydroxylase
MDIDMEHCDAKLSALVQLSAADSYEGGVLGFGLPLLPAYREQGSLLVFPAWMPHQVTPTRSGIRYSLLYSALGPSFR